MAKAKAASRPQTSEVLKNELVLGALIAELVASFALTLAVLNTQGNAIVAAVVVIVLVLIFGSLSGAHINPLASIALCVTRQISWIRMLGYLLAQFLGAMLAVVVASSFLAGSEATSLGLYSINVMGEWKPFFGEFLGAIVFGLGVAAVFLTRKEGFDAAFTIGGALLLGLIAATIGSNGILNPAVALALNAFDLKNNWGILAYGLAPILGVTLGALLYKLLQSDIALGTRSSKNA